MKEGKEDFRSFVLPCSTEPKTRRSPSSSPRYNRPIYRRRTNNYASAASDSIEGCSSLIWSPPKSPSKTSSVKSRNKTELFDTFLTQCRAVALREDSVWEGIQFYTCLDLMEGQAKHSMLNISKILYLLKHIIQNGVSSR